MEGNMSEYIYQIYENGEIKGLCDRKKAHQSGILHLSVQCWVMNEKGEVLIQRRSNIKDKSVGKFDVSFGGHCVETLDDTDILITNVVKEGAEELGLNIQRDEIINIGSGRYTSSNGQNKELIHVYLIYRQSNTTFVFYDGEVSETKWIDIDTLYNNILNHPNMYAQRILAVSLLKNYIQMDKVK